MWESDQCKEQNNVDMKSAVLPSLQSNFLKEVEFHPFKYQPVQKESETMFKRSQCDLKKRANTSIFPPVIAIIIVYHIIVNHIIKRLYLFSIISSLDNCLSLLQIGKVLMVICTTEGSVLETDSKMTNWSGTRTIINKTAIIFYPMHKC